jgi:hypothetical protein
MDRDNVTLHCLLCSETSQAVRASKGQFASVNPNVVDHVCRKVGLVTTLAADPNGEHLSLISSDNLEPFPDGHGPFTPE